MRGKRFFVATVAALLLFTAVMPQMAVPLMAGHDTPAQTITWSASRNDWPVLPVGGFHLNGNCETIGSGSCPPY
jgi:hypothetical protein